VTMFIETERTQVDRGCGQPPQRLHLIELLVVIAIIAILAAMLLPAWPSRKIRPRGRNASAIPSRLASGADVWRMISRYVFVRAGEVSQRRWLVYQPKIHRSHYSADADGSPNNDTPPGGAYWGLGYYNYVGKNQKVFACPQRARGREWRDVGIKLTLMILAFLLWMCQYLLVPYTGSGSTYGAGSTAR